MGNLLQNVLTMHWMQTVGVLVFMIGILIGASAWLWLLCHDLAYDPYFRIGSWRKLFHGYLNPFAWLYVGIALLGLGQLLKWSNQLGLDSLSTVFFVGSVLCGLVSLTTLASVGFARLVGDRKPNLLDYGFVPMGVLAAVLLLALSFIQLIRCGEFICR